MKTKIKKNHTPGPWIADGNGFEPTYDISNEDGSIATVKTTRADADLMAAAPELFDALERIINLQDAGLSDAELKLKVRETAIRALATIYGVLE